MTVLIPESLQVALENDRLAHAYLFYGRRPDNFRPIVLDFFKALKCQEKGFLKTCGKCMECNQVDSLTHPDVVSPGISMQEQTIVSDTRVGVDTIRSEVIEAASLTPARSSYKLFWLSDVNRFTVDASNTLLKVLEEPPGETVFVLTAQSRWDCLATIRSRCQWVRFSAEHESADTVIELCNGFWNELSFDSDNVEEWVDLLDGKQTVYDFTWNKERAKKFMGLMIGIIYWKHAQQTRNELVPDSVLDRISYRLFPDLLDRLDELERGGNPDLIVSSLLEEIFMPEEDTEWRHAI